MNESFWNKMNEIKTPKEDSILPCPHMDSLTSINVPDGMEIRLLFDSDLETMKAFLYKEFHYAYMWQTPDMCINVDHLRLDLINGAYGIGCWHSGEMIGCIWARPVGYIGRMHSKLMSSNESALKVNNYLVEHLCVAERARGIGVARLLLNYIVLTRPTSDIRFIFLKEGKAVPTNFISWDNYLYARIPGKIINRIRERLRPPSEVSQAPIIIRKQQCQSITLEEAIEWCKTNMAGTNITMNFPSYTTRTGLWLWRSKALMAISDTYQIHPLDGQRIGLITGWYCSAGVSSQDRCTAQIDIFQQQPYTWLWSAKSYTEDFAAEWIRDGIVWWQPYAWNMPTLMSDLFMIL